MFYFAWIQEHKTREDCSKMHMTEENTYSPLTHYVCHMKLTTMNISCFLCAYKCIHRIEKIIIIIIIIIIINNNNNNNSMIIIMLV